LASKVKQQDAKDSEIISRTFKTLRGVANLQEMVTFERLDELLAKGEISLGAYQQSYIDFKTEMLLYSRLPKKGGRKTRKEIPLPRRSQRKLIENGSGSGTCRRLKGCIELRSDT